MGGLQQLHYILIYERTEEKYTMEGGTMDIFGALI